MPADSAFLQGPADADPIDAAALSKLRWRCRRGLLENDWFIARFFERHASTLTYGQARGLYALMQLSDNDLMDALLGRDKPLPPEAQDWQAMQTLAMLRQSGRAAVSA